MKNTFQSEIKPDEATVSLFLIAEMFVFAQYVLFLGFDTYGLYYLHVLSFRSSSLYSSSFQAGFCIVTFSWSMTKLNIYIAQIAK